MTASILRMDPFALMLGFLTSRAANVRIVHLYFARWVLVLNFGEDAA